MITNFQKSIDFVLSEEGGFTNDAHDPGGATNYGIIQTEYNAYRKSKSLPTQSVKYIKDDEYEEIYKKQYWDVLKCGVLPSGIDIAVFDSGVNCGVGTSVKFLQRALSVSDDGILGPITLEKINKTKDISALISSMLDYRMKYYKALKTFKYFGKGWSARVVRLRKLAPTLIGSN